MIQSEVDSAPNTSLCLLSSRTTIRKRLRDIASTIKSDTGCADRLAMRNAAKPVLDECVSNSGNEMGEVLNTQQRWAPPATKPVPVPRVGENTKPARATRETAFGILFQSKWRRCCKTADPRLCVQVIEARAGSILSVWMCCSMYKTIGYFLELQRMSDSLGVRVKKPFSFITYRSLFASFFCLSQRRDRRCGT